MKRRLQIVNSIMAYIDKKHDLGETIYIKRLVAEICLTYSCGERLVLEILKHLVLTEKIKFDDDKIIMEENK